MFVFPNLTIVLMLLIFAVPAEAMELPAEEVEKISKIAHEAMSGSSIDGKTPIGKEKAATLQYPLVDLKTREATIIRGSLSGFAAGCKMNWQERSFVPFMQQMREANKDWNDYQFAYIGVLHGISMGSAERAIANIKDSCNEKNKASLEESLYK